MGQSLDPEGVVTFRYSLWRHWTRAGCPIRRLKPLINRNLTLKYPDGAYRVRRSVKRNSIPDAKVGVRKGTSLTLAITPTVQIMIASPLEPEHCEAIQRALPPHARLLYEPSLLPPLRYIADHKGMEGFRRTPEQEERWQYMAASADIAFDFPYTDRPPRSYAPNLKWVQTTSAGVGQMVKQLGIAPTDLLITTASGVHARPLTEFVMMVLLMAVKDYDRISSCQRTHTWERFCADELTGKTLVIIGPGKIGQEVARIARCLDMHPIALARSNDQARASNLGFDRFFIREELPEVLHKADAVVVCAPHTPETENLLDRTAFDALKPGVVLINIGRGELIDEDALLAKLLDGTIKLAGLDVFRSEPLPSESPFWNLPNVMVSPHSASTSILENRRIVQIFIHNLECYLDERLEDMSNLLDIERMY